MAPEMTGLGIGGGGAAGMGAMAAVSGYRDTSNRSENTRSDPPSEPYGYNSARSPDRLLPPVAAGVRSWSSSSPPANHPTSNMSVSDQSEYSQGGNGHFHQPPPANAAAATAPVAAAGYFAHPSELPANERNVEHNLAPPNRSFPEDDVMSHQSYQQANVGDDGYWSGSRPSNPSAPSNSSAAAAQDQYELAGNSPNLGAAQPAQSGYRGVDPEVPLHQRVEGNRVPYRPGHLGASHNF